MSSLRQKGGVLRVAWFLFLVICTAQTLVRPGVAMQGAARGMQLCCETVIPSLFPFLVLCELLLQSPLAAFFGIPFVPLARALGIRSRRAPAALFCGLLGGFASAARSVDRMYRESEISQREASVLLVCCVGSSPAFIIGSAGYAMLGNVKAGWFLLAGQFTASLICGFAAARLTPAGKRDFSLPPCPAGKRCRRCRARRSILHGNFMRLYYFVFFSGKSLYPQYCLTPEAVCHKPSARGDSGVPESQHLCTSISCAAVHGRP